MSMNKREGRKMSVTSFYRNIINEAIEPTLFDADGIAKVKAAADAAESVWKPSRSTRAGSATRWSSMAQRPVRNI